MTDNNWFTTTPEAVMRAEGILHAFDEDRITDIGHMLASDQGGITDPVHLLNAFIFIADRTATWAAELHQEVHGGTTTRADVLAGARAGIAAVAIEKQQGGDQPG